MNGGGATQGRARIALRAGRATSPAQSLPAHRRARSPVAAQRTAPQTAAPAPAAAPPRHPPSPRSPPRPGRPPRAPAAPSATPAPLPLAPRGPGPGLLSPVPVAHNSGAEDQGGRLKAQPHGDPAAGGRRGGGARGRGGGPADRRTARAARHPEGAIPPPPPPPRALAPRSFPGWLGPNPDGVLAGASRSGSKAHPPLLVLTQAQVAAATGRAAWIAGTAFLVLVVPLILEMDREQQLTEMENQQMGVLTNPASSSTPAAGAK